MDARSVNNVSEKLFECFNYIRSTVEGVLACNNSSVWNVFGGLSRTKNAVFNILVNELRSHQNNYTPEQLDQDSSKPACGKLVEFLQNHSYAEISSEAEETEELLLLWIEQHLLDHSLYACIKYVHEPQNQDPFKNLYKEFAFLKNSILFAAFLSCLDALQQNSMDQLSSINPSLMNKFTFMNEITPWITDKMSEEYKIDHLPPEKLTDEWMSNLRVPSSSYENSLCENCGQNMLITETKVRLCGCADIVSSSNIRFRANTVGSQRSLTQDVLINSALTAVLKNNDQSSWYGEEDQLLQLHKSEHNIDNLRTRLSRMKEISRSESSLFQEAGHICEVKETHSGLDDVNSENNETLVEQSEDAISIQSMTLPRSSSHVQKKRNHIRSKSDQVGSVVIDNIDGESKVRVQISTSFPRQEDTAGYYQSEDGQLFPKPYKGQSLLSYLESRSYDTGAQLDKENAHFSICEALITAMEQMRCDSIASGNESDDGSDEEIKILKTKLSECRSRRKIEKQIRDSSAFSDPSDTGKSSSLQTSSTLSSSVDSSTEDAKILSDIATLQETRGHSISGSWENVSLAANKSRSLDTYKGDGDKVELIQDDEIPPGDFSAEAVAKSLLKKFQGQSIPAASELKWIVSEEDVPQQLLPLPTAWPINPDTHLEENDHHSVESGLPKVSMPSLLRGNLEWAPPRPQIIFSPHVFVKRKVVLQRQHYRCAGCGLKVTPSLSKRFRYCEYLGKYFCSSCHQNKLAIIPANILSKWDFKKYPVSDFAKDLLKKIYRDPLFNVSDIASNLYQNVRFLAITKNLRLQLHYMKNFLRTCRHAESCQREIAKISMHLADDPHAYSIFDLVQTKNGEIHTTMKAIVLSGIEHIKKECQLCSAKGFVCEFCRDFDDILYPFELNKVFICLDCKTCYHRACFVQGKCGRCERIKARQKMIQEQLPDLVDAEK